MKITKIKLQNWKNFKNIDAKLSNRTFIVGPNASGKSNFLDLFRFLRDISKGRLQDAVMDRGGMSKIRSLSARKNTEIALELEMTDDRNKWKYYLAINNKPGKKEVYITHETVKKNNGVIINRPDDDDKKDEVRLTQTFLEQVSANAGFREIANYFQSFNYLHIVPQVVRNSEGFNSSGTWDAFGRNFLEIIANTPVRTRNSRLKKIENVLIKAAPQLTELQLVTDNSGKPHMAALYDHWGDHSARQQEDQFSDGTLRLIGILWILMENDSLLLLEEPELSLNQGIVEKLPSMMYRALKNKKKQLLVSTHSADLLSDRSIGGEEVLLLIPGKEGTEIIAAADEEQIRALLDGGMAVADAVIPVTKPQNLYQTDWFK